jgi:hypothetical protein
VREQVSAGGSRKDQLSVVGQAGRHPRVCSARELKQTGTKMDQVHAEFVFKAFQDFHLLHVFRLPQLCSNSESVELEKLEILALPAEVL